MGEEISICLRLLEIIASSNARLFDFSRRLWTAPRVAKTQGGIEIRGYSSGVAVERYVEADLHDATNICWWLEFTCADGRWSIETRIYISHGDTIKAFADRSASTITQLSDELEHAIGDFFESVEILPELRELLGLSG